MPDAVTGNARAAGGWIISGQESKEHILGVEWKSKLGQENSPKESELENYLTGWSGGVSIGYGVGGDVVTTISNDPTTVGGEVGVYTPQGGGGAAYGVFLYDAGNDTPWFWQKYWGWGVNN